MGWKPLTISDISADTGGMSERSETERLPFRCPSVTGPHSRGALSDFLTYLAFEGHAIRIGLEVSASVLLFQCFMVFMPWNSIGITPEWQAIWSWFTSCFLVIVLDQLVLFRAVYTFRKAYQLCLAGAYEAALSMLEKIAPERGALVRCPPAMFHLLRADILIQSETFRSAELELELAKAAGASGERLAIARGRLHIGEAAESGYARAHEELQSAKAQFGESAVLCLEESLLRIEEHKDLWEAKRVLKRVAEMPDELHFAGDVTSQLAKASLQAARLWTGEAEEGLEELNMAIERLRSLASYADALRLELTTLQVERSLYLATHKEPELACFDLRMGLTLCNTPRMRKKAEKIEEELSWRYKSFSAA